MLEPDRKEIDTFVVAMFKHAGTEGFVSVRSFYEEKTQAFRITPTGLIGGLSFLADVAEDDARRAANDPHKVVFCPPIAVFSNKNRAGEADLSGGLCLSIECDRSPNAARVKLEQLLGPATLIVASGGKWVDPETGEVQDKLHLHWRLNTVARGEDLGKLKRARDLATRIVGGDPSNKPVCHPIRWPGSWHRKGEPILCRIVASAEAEIDLAAALEILTAAAPAGSKANGKGDSESPRDWVELVKLIIAGEDYHAALASLASKMLLAGMGDGAAVNLLRSLMEASAGPRDVRWWARYNDIPRAVATAREKVGGWREQNNAGGEQGDRAGVLVRADGLKPESIDWAWRNRFAFGKLAVLAGDPGLGKSTLLIEIVALHSIGGEFPCGEGCARQCECLILTAEDGLRDTVVPRLIAAGADMSKVHFLTGTKTKGVDGEAMFDLAQDIAVLRAVLKENPAIRVLVIDPLTAYLGATKAKENAEVRRVLAPLVQLIDETRVLVIGNNHLNKGAGKAIYRVLDSIAFVAVGRVVHLVIKDADFPENRKFICDKTNIGSRPLGLTYLIQKHFITTEDGEEIETSRICWGTQHIDESADEALGEHTDPTATDDAVDFLKALLANGPMRAADIETEARDACLLGEDQRLSQSKPFRSARKILGVITAKSGMREGWTWGLMPKTPNVP